MIGSYYGISTPLILFYSSVITMQLIEYFAWTYPEYNHQISILAISLLCIQPIASLFTMTSNRMIWIFIYIIGMMTYLYFRPFQNVSMSIGKDGHLAWNWMNANGTLPILFYLFFLFIPLIINHQWEFLIVALFTLGFSIYRYASYGTWGSMWCWISQLCILLSCIKHMID
jgi:hypothetical protein